MDGIRQRRGLFAARAPDGRAIGASTTKVSGTASELELTITYQEAEDRQVMAQIAEVPAAISFGGTREEARESVLDALRELALSYLETPPTGEGEREAIRIAALR